MVTMATRMINLSLPMGLLAPLILFLILPFAEPKRGVINDYTCIDIHVDGVKWSSLVHSGKFIGSYNTCIHHIRRIYKSIEYYVQFRRMNLELSKLSMLFSFLEKFFQCSDKNVRKKKLSEDRIFFFTFKITLSCHGS